jgi:predicted N-formylglutamate amidohydrolase
MKIDPLTRKTLAKHAVEVIQGNSTTPVVLICEHASNRVPRPWGSLGLSEHRLQEHIAWDLGAAELTRSLAITLDVPAVLAGYSRLFADCNRASDSTEFAPSVSGGIRVPGNENLSVAERDMRDAIAFKPFHATLSTVIERRLASVGNLLCVALHSYCANMNGASRPWEIGVLWDTSSAAAHATLSYLRGESAGRIWGNPLIVGDNQPYSRQPDCGFTLGAQAGARGLSNLVFEIQQHFLHEPVIRKKLVDLLAGSIHDALHTIGD